MPPVSSPPTAACSHDLGRGTTVCLRCRQERRDDARARQQRLFGLSGVVAMGLLGVYVMGASAANAWHAAAANDTSLVPSRASVVASSVSGGGEVKQQGESAVAVAPAATRAPVVAPAAAAATTTAAAPWQAPLPLIVREGRTDLSENLIAERGGDSVIVDFDTPATRTRRRDKFESVVRRTLPLVYGGQIDSVLRAIPEGSLIAGSDLLTELPKRGVHLRVAEGWALDFWPETRAGQDGPLVIGYRARVTRDGALR